VSLHNRIDVAILGAVLQEVVPFFSFIHENDRSFHFRGETLRIGTCNNLGLLIGTTGLGKVNAAITTAAILERFPVSQVWNVGCAGSYAGGPLRMGDVLISQEALCGDEGILTQNGPLSAESIGIPIFIHAERAVFDRIPLNQSPTVQRLHTLTPPGEYHLPPDGPPALSRRAGSSKPQEAQSTSEGQATPQTRCVNVGGVQVGKEAEHRRSFRVAYGPSLTVGMVSGDPAVADERFQKYGAFAENMEGSAVAQTCFRFDVPMTECRGISNIAGDRCKKNWRMETAMAHCQGIVAIWLTAHMAWLAAGDS